MIRSISHLGVGVACLLGAATLQARSPKAEPDVATKIAAPSDAVQRWIVRLESPPASAFGGQRGANGSWKLAPTRPAANQRFDANSKAVVAYRDRLASERRGLLDEMASEIGRRVTPLHEYWVSSHGMSLDLSAAEAERIRQLPGVAAVIADRAHRMHTDAGPSFIGAPAVWDGSATGTGSGTLGEGVVVGVLDSGVNWDHPAFADPGADGYDHANPRSSQLGLCSLPQVRCNDKLIGVYDFTEEGSNGKDTDSHGSHVASTVLGNRRTARIAAQTVTLDIPVSGVAPHANLIAYKVCNTDDPNTADDEGTCPGSAILAALDQVVIDNVDVINYSLGSDERDPWDESISPIATTMLNVRASGTLIVASAGNGGPGDATISSPSNAPWVVAVANIRHDRRFSNILEMMSGGDTPPPEDLDGAGVTAGFGPAPIVHARDFGNALCGTGAAELQPDCEGHTGSSNPFAPGTFNGEIVVCDRGTFGRVEKGFNLRAAGAGGYVLANTDAQGETIVGDDHCLPGLHLGDQDGDALRQWLDSGSGHQAVISGQSRELDPALGDVVSSGSSRGPTIHSPAVIKPDVAAPGTDILAADLNGSDEGFKTGTSMASPHVAGLAALLISSGTASTPSQLHSLLMTGALKDGMRDDDGVSPARVDDVGAGRARADRSVGSGLFLDVTTSQFLNANPALGGDPAALNLPGLVESNCFLNCSFSRVVTDLGGGSQWTTHIVGPAGVAGSVSPASFSLTSGASRTLSIELDVSDAHLTGSLVEGAVVLTDSDGKEVRLPFSVFSDPGSLPDDLRIVTDTNQGSRFLEFDQTVPLPDAEYITLPLQLSMTAEEDLPQDFTRDDPYDNLNIGVMVRSVTVNSAGGLVVAETVPQLNGDLDLYVGRDLDGDGPEASEELCQSTSSGAAERCVIRNASAGNYWILAQNWQGLSPQDATRIRYVAVQNTPGTSLVATGPGRIDEAGTDFDVRVIWDRGAMKSGEHWFGALIPKSSRASGMGELGQVVVELVRSTAPAGDPADPSLDRLPGYAMLPGETQTFALAAGEGHGRLFVDVPEGASALQVDIDSSRDMDLYVVRDDASFAAPDVARVSALDQALAQAIGPGGVHQIDLQGSPHLTPGRYYLVPVNMEASKEGRVAVSLEVEHSGNSLVPVQGLWFNPARGGAGFNLNLSTDQLVIEWYTYLEDGSPTWYLAQGPFPPAGNVWSAPLFHFNWNGQSAAPTEVGQAILVFESATDLVFNYRINGTSGSEPYTVIVPDLSCDTQGSSVALTGLWFVPAKAGFGYSILSLDGQQIHINYLYDGLGTPRWVYGQDDLLTNGDMDLVQFSGFCPSCPTVPSTLEAVGMTSADFNADNISGNLSTQVEFLSPVPGSWMESGAISNLTPTISCP